MHKVVRILVPNSGNESLKKGMHFYLVQKVFGKALMLKVPVSLRLLSPVCHSKTLGTRYLKLKVRFCRQRNLALFEKLPFLLQLFDFAKEWEGLFVHLQ